MKQQVLQVDKSRICYFELGSGPYIVFLHGGLMCANDYEKTLISLSKNFHVIAPDIPGFGCSHINQEIINIQTLSRTIIKFLDLLGIEEYTLIGHSFGAKIAREIGFSDKRIGKQVLIDPTGVGENPNLLIKFLQLCYKTFNNLFKYPNRKNSTLTILNSLNFLWRGRHSLYKTIKLLKQSYIFENNIESNPNLPVQIIYGLKDEFVNQSQIKFFAQNINSELIFVNGNHDWCIVYPNKLKSFLLQS